MFYLLKANCQYNHLTSIGDLYHGVNTQNKENLPANIAGKANNPTKMIAAFHNRWAIFAGDDRHRQTVALDNYGKLIFLAPPATIFTSRY